jgi:GTP-binding protein
MAGLIAIVGRPNVGKSALFNRVVGRRIAIVHDEPGVTRDRVSAEAEWGGRAFTLVDTGGIGLLRREKAQDVIIKAALEQVELAIEAANVIVLVVNVQEGLTPLDIEAAKRLRKSGKPVLVAANKVDTHRLETAAMEFTELGFKHVFPVSAIHGEGIENLMAAALGLLPEELEIAPLTPALSPGERGKGPSAVETSSRIEGSSTVKEAPDRERGAAEEEDAELHETLVGPIKLAIVGRPNVGKSSIINSLTQSERVIVSPIPGTTRDAVDVPFTVETEGMRQNYVLIDTAGMRKSRRIDNSIEFFSVKRSEESIARCDLAVLVLDAEAGITEQDKKVADKIVEGRKPCIVVVNKWDLVEEQVRKSREEEVERRTSAKRNRDERRVRRLTTLGEFGHWVQEHLFFLDYAPVIFTSAQSGFNLERLLEAVRYVTAQLRQKIPTALLNRAINDAVERRQPISAQGHRLRFFYATQVRQAPPTFLLFVNRDELFSEAYKKYLADEIRGAFGYEGCPVILVPKPRPKTVEPVRRYKSGRGQTRRGR